MINFREFRKPDRRKKKPTCYFAVPDDDTTHSKMEVIFEVLFKSINYSLV